MEKSKIPTPRVDALDCGLYGYSDYVRVLPQIVALARELECELEEMHAAIIDALENCEVCRGEKGPRRCARCLTFEKIHLAILNDQIFSSQLPQNERKGEKLEKGKGEK